MANLNFKQPIRNLINFHFVETSLGFNEVSTFDDLIRFLPKIIPSIKIQNPGIKIKKKSYKIIAHLILFIQKILELQVFFNLNFSSHQIQNLFDIFDSSDQFLQIVVEFSVFRIYFY